MRASLALLVACAAATAASAEERWEFPLGGQVAGSEKVEETAAGLRASGSFTFQGATIGTSYDLSLDAEGTPTSYALALSVGATKVTVASAASPGSLAFTVSQKGVVAGTRSFALSPTSVILDNNVFSQYRQLSRSLSPEGPARAAVRMLVPQTLSQIELESVRRPGTWRWMAGERTGVAVHWELSSAAPLLVRLWQDIGSGRIVQAEIPQAKTVVRLAGATLVADPQVAAPRPAYLSSAIEETELPVRSGSFQLGATLARPSGASGRLPGVVIVGGSGPNNRDGEIGANRPYRDIAAAVRLLAADARVDPARISLVGHSRGAWVLPLAMETLGTDAARIRHLALDESHAGSGCSAIGQPSPPWRA